MESKKTNIFVLLLAMIMCVFSIVISMKNSVKNGVDGETAYEIAVKNGFKGTEQEWLKSLEKGKDGLTAYEVAVLDGYAGTEGEWLLSLKGENGQNALTNVTTIDIYEAYLDTINKTESEFSYEDFLVYYYSVVDEHDTKTATQIAYSSTVDICYSFTEYVYFVEKGYSMVGETEVPAYKIISDSNGNYSSDMYGVSAGAGVIYDMIDTDKNGNYDTAYIITNYHVAYLAGYCSDDNYVVYQSQDASGNTDYFVGTAYKQSDLKTGTNSYYPYYYFLESAITIPNESEIIDNHFLNGENDNYYGVYVYGYQTADCKLNATFVGGSADNDIAVLKIERDNISTEMATLLFDSNYYVPATLGDSSAIIGGEEVIAVGNPLIPDTSNAKTREEVEQAYISAMCLSSTSGNVSVVTDDDCLFESIIDSSKAVKMRLMRVDAAINSGNSGGGLYDLYGNLVGIVNSKIASSVHDNIGFAIPINTAVSIAKQVIEQCDGVLPSSDNTRIDIFKAENVGFEIANGKSTSKPVTDSSGNKSWIESYNILVKNVVGNSVADIAGFKNEDIIKSVTFGGVTYNASTYFRNYHDLARLFMDISLNETKITITVSRLVESAMQDVDIDILISADSFTELV